MSRDARLQWRQLSVAQPNTAGLLREMRGGINDAASAAEGILGRYQEGAELKAENELARRIGGKSQEELQGMFNSGAFDDLNLGENGLATLNSAVSGAADVANTNSIVRNRDGRLVLAQNQDGREATRFGWATEDRNRSQAQQAWLQDNASAFLDAERNALTGGTSFSAHIDRNESGGGNDQYDTLFGHRNRNNGVRVSQMTIGEAGAFASPSGEYGQSVNAEIGRVATPMGKFQIVGSTLRGLQDDLQLPDDVPFSPQVQEQLGLLLAQRRVEGRSQAAAREGLRAEWEGFKNVSDAELDVMIDEIRQMPTVTRDSVLAAAAGGSPAIPGQPAAQPFARPTTQATQTGFGGDSFAAAMAASGQFTPQEILGQVDPLRSAATRGDELIDQEDAALTADVVAGITQNVVSSDNFQPGDLAGAQTSIQEALEATGEYSTAEAAGLASNAVQQIENDAALSAEFNRGATTEVQSAIINEALNNAMAQSTREFQGQDQYRALNDIGRYTEDPTKNLEGDLGIGSDGETPDGYDSNVLRNYINDLADEFNVEPAVMAVAMRDAFIRDPGRGGFPGDWTRNTIANRFDKEQIAATVQQLTPQRRAEFDRARSELTINETRLRQNATAQQQIEARLNRMDEDNPQRESLEDRLDDLIKEAAEYSRSSANLEGR